MNRVCKSCGSEKTLAEEFFRPHHTGIGFRWGCRECERKSRRQAYANNPAHYNAKALEAYYLDPATANAKRKNHRRNNPEQHKSAVLRRTYGITLEDYNRMLLSQNGVCAICKVAKTGTEDRRLFVDHCHTTGKVRGLLCNACNTILGRSNDSVERLLSAIQYLQKS